MLIEADNLLKNKNYSQARTLYRLSLEQGTEKALAHLGIAITAYYLKEYSESESNALKALELNSDLYRAHLFLAYIYARLNDYDNCEAAISRALIIAPNDPDVLSFGGGVYVSRGREKDGIEMLDKAVQINPNDWMAYFNLGSFYFLQKDYKGAVLQYLKSYKFKKSLSTLLKIIILYLYIYRVVIVIFMALLTLVSFYLKSIILLFIVTMPVISVGFIGILNKHSKGLLIVLLGLIPWLLFLIVN